MKNCEYCNKEHDGSYGSGRFCKKECARGFSTKVKRKEINKKVSKKLEGRSKEGAKDRVLNIPLEKKKLGGIKGVKAKQEKYYKIYKNFYDNGEYSKLCTRKGNPNNSYKRFILQDQNGVCNKCGNNKWLDFILILELRHKDGNKYNNERDNLEYLCPNCHSTTSTWRNKNRII